MGLDSVGVNFLFFGVSLSCLHFACVLALSFFFFSFLFFAFFLFPLIFVFCLLFFFVFLCFCFFFWYLRFFLYNLFQEILVFSDYFQAVAVDCPSVFGYGGTAKPEKKKRGISLRPTPSTPTLSETFQAMLLFQGSDPMTQALG